MASTKKAKQKSEEPMSEETVVPEEEVVVQNVPVVEPTLSNAPELMKGAPWIIVYGDSGMGKSRLVGKYPDVYALDTEPPGGASAYKASHRKDFMFRDTMYADVEKTVDNLLAHTVKEGRVRKGNGITISALSVDTFDVLQDVLISKFLSQKPRPPWEKSPIWAPAMQQQDWGQILNYQQPLILKLKQLEIPIIFVCHETIKEPERKGTQLLTLGEKRIDVAGSIRKFIINLCTVMLYIDINPDNTRVVYTQPCVVRDYKINVKDQHGIFGSKLAAFSLTADENGYPTREVIKYITDRFDY